MVRSEQRYRPSSSSVAYTAAGARSTKRGSWSTVSTAARSSALRARGEDGRRGRSHRGRRRRVSVAPAPPTALHVGAMRSRGPSSVTAAIRTARLRAAPPATPRVFLSLHESLSPLRPPAPPRCFPRQLGDLLVPRVTH